MSKLLGSGKAPPAAFVGMATARVPQFQMRARVEVLGPTIHAAERRARLLGEVNRRADEIRGPLSAREALGVAARELEGLDASTSSMLRKSALDAAAYALLALEALDLPKDPGR